MNEPDLLANKAAYLEEWTIAFREIAGWPESAALEWANRWRDDLDDPNSWLWHDDPMYWIALTFVPHGFFERHQGVSPPILRDRISDAILDHEERAMGRGVSTYDAATWRAIKSEIESILGEYGESLNQNE